MHANGVPLDTYSLCSSFTAATSVGDAELGKQVHGLYVKSGWSSSVFVGSSLVGLYSKLLFIRDAEVVFDEIPVKNTVCANTLLSGYGEAKMWIEGLELARRMPILNLSYDNFSLSAMLRACAGLSAVELGKQVHAYVIHKICDLAKDVFLQSSLIEMYGKCGLVGKARLVFDLAGTELRVQRRKDIVLWTSMLDGVTFVTLISACCHTGQVKLGIKYFDSMVHHFNLEPGPEHYSCLVDLLCRTGELDKAWKLADEMLAKGNNGTISLWGSLLSSCEDCGNIELGTLAAQKALELEPQNIGIYTKLSNLYARLGMWDEIDRLKESMKQRGLKKDLANSWIESLAVRISCNLAKEDGSDQSEISGFAPKIHRTKMGEPEVSEKKILNKKLKDVEISVPIVYGNIAFWLGKKANEYQSHKWTVYVRGATNEDLGVVIKRVVFQLHSSFNNPTRVVESPPFELSESGWGEFEIAITLFFHNDVCDKPLNLFHHLKLYPEDESGPMSMKKPVVVESYDEIVFPEPSEGFLARMQNHPAVNLPRLPAGFILPPPVPVEDATKKKRGDTKDNPLSQWFMNFSEADELLQLAAARQQVSFVYLYALSSFQFTS
ncbi:hypothetical protein HS088_TW22G01542 [Tripterygium wilfordii]|uniref:YEATS domain-containing protein n=1 Tax=Tripterygium wilfordii TaxID=458696 RepID=A0A7J7C1P5_TRIWF|nr:hypothetical protein HS088_TW22G01542 [Tripterygium wilfordii]